MTTENKSQLSNITIDDNARSEISQALSIGLEVTVHERPINVYGWEGSGYSIIDTDYGVGAYKISGGANGGQVNSSNLAIASSGLLGITDSYTSAKLPDGKPWFSKVLKKIWNQGQLSKWTGYLGLGISLLMVLFDDSIPLSDKLAQISMNLLGFGISGYIITALAGAATVIGLGLTILFSILTAVAIAVAITYINTIYFSHLNIRMQKLNIRIC